MPTDEEIMKHRYHEFLDLLPLTLAIAGLPPSPGPLNYSEDQMEVRTHTVLMAFKLARHTAREVVKPA